MPSTIDDDLSQLDRDIRQLKIEYEQYFGGGKMRPPTDLEWRIDIMMKRYSDRGAQMSYSQRFRYGNLVQAYTKYREMFRKRMKQKEEGTVQRHFGAAARELEKERTRKRGSGAKANGIEQFPFSVTWKDPDQEKKKVEQLFSALRLAKEQLGEKTDRLTLEAFQQFVREKTEQLKKQKNVSEVEYIVTVEGKHSRLKARAKS
jgi:hypothetical protein